MGKVYFVGAGSGAPDLITVRGQRLLREADMIIYAGSLVNPELLKNAKPGCEIYDSARLHLGQVMELMITAARADMTVARLHTGDPSIYGAIREQMDRLDEAGIAYEVCPGVSSFCGAAASLKKEYTLPGVSQTLILTRMEGRTPVPDSERIRALAAHGASMAVFLSASMLEGLQAELLAGGAYSASTPCAIVYKATWPDEIKIETTLGELVEEAERAGIKKTALILVGDFLGDKYELSKLYDAGFETGFRRAEPHQEKALSEALSDDLLQASKQPHVQEKTAAGGTDCHTDTSQAVRQGGQRVINAAVISYTQKGRRSARRIAEAAARLDGLTVNIKRYAFDRSCGIRDAVTKEKSTLPINDAIDIAELSAYEAEPVAEYEPAAADTALAVLTALSNEEYFDSTSELMKMIFAGGTRGDARSGAEADGSSDSSLHPKTDAVIFVSAAGIAVRAAAPFIKSKVSDPAVIAADDDLNYVIPLLSGHIGGANTLSRALADALEAEAVITTASDNAGKEAADIIAERKGFALQDMEAAKLATAALLRKRTDAGSREELRLASDSGQCELLIDDIRVPMRPLRYVIGIGCKKNTPADRLYDFIRALLSEAGIAQNEIYRVASIDLKAGETAVKAVADALNAPYYVYSAEELTGIPGEFTGSEFVEAVTGVDCVCERSAAAACGGEYEMIVKKRAGEGLTAAVAVRLTDVQL